MPWNLLKKTDKELEKVLKHYQDSPEKLAAAHFLIQNIDLAFKVWKERPWNKNLCFEDFCELILPCRIANEKLSDWRYTYHNRYAPLLDSLYKGNDVIEACNTLMRILRTEGFYYNAQFKIPHLDALFFKRKQIWILQRDLRYQITIVYETVDNIYHHNRTNKFLFS